MGKRNAYVVHIPILFRFWSPMTKLKVWAVKHSNGPVDSTCYEFFTPNGNVRAIESADGRPPRWVRPLETYDPAAGKTNAVSKDPVNSIELVFGNKFFVDTGPYDSGTLNDVVSYETNVVVKKQCPDEIVNDNGNGGAKYALPVRCDSEIAFGVRVYQMKRSRPSFVKLGDHETWEWISSALIPWCALMHRDGNRYVAFQTKSISDRRMQVPETRTWLVIELVRVNEPTVQFGKYLPPAGSSSFYPRLVNDLKKVFQEFVIPERLRMMRTEFHVDAEFSQVAKDCLVGTLGVAPEGVDFVCVDDTDDVWTSNSTQSWYRYDDVPVVTARWILARYAEIQSMHTHPTRPEDDLVSIKTWKPSDRDGQNYERLRCRLTDVIRLATMHSATRPYIPDHVENERGEWIESDKYSPGLTLPGDCEDGAQAAYLIYSTLLLGMDRVVSADPKLTKTEKRTLYAIRDLAAISGVPIGVSGTSYNPLTNVDGDSHAFGVVVPYPEFVRATYGANRVKEAMDVFQTKFGFAYPTDFPNRIKVMETTLFCCPTYETHDPDALGVRDVVEEWLQDLDEWRCAWTNFALLHYNDETTSCQNYVIRGYTTFGKTFLPSFRPISLDGKEDENAYTCTFAFVNVDGKIGIPRHEMFGERPVSFSLRAPVFMTRDVWDAETRVLTWIRPPIVPLVPIEGDPYKPDEFESRTVTLTALDRPVRSGPHAVVFVYDFTIRDALDRVAELVDRLKRNGHENARFVLRPYGFAYVALLHDLDPPPPQIREE